MTLAPRVPTRTPRAATEPVAPRIGRLTAAKTWPWAIGAVVLGVAGARWPVPTLVGLGAVAVLVMAFARPRTTVAVTVVIVMFVRPLERVTGLDAVGYLDESFVLLCLVALPLRRVVVTRRRLRTFPGQWWFAGFVVAGLLSALVVLVPPNIFLLGAFVTSKGLLFAWAVAQVDWEERHLAVAARIGVVLILLCLAAALVNLAAPAAWFAVMASDLNSVEARSFLPSLIGPFTHPLDFGQIMALSFVALMTWRTVVGRTPLTLVLMMATGLAALGTARRTAVGAVATAWVWLQAKLRSTAVLVALLACVPIAAVVLGPPLVLVAATTYNDYIGNGTREARTVLTVDGFKIAAEYFPGGAGFGRFGSAVAATNYSPEYVKLGYPNIWGLGRTAVDGRFLTDTEWPAVIGEAGFIGALLFAVGLFSIYRAGLRLWRRAATPLVRWAGLTAAGWIVASLVESVATVTFTGPPALGLVFGLAGLIAAVPDGEGDDPPEPELDPRHPDAAMTTMIPVVTDTPTAGR